jgi:hypothetical protein
LGAPTCARSDPGMEIHMDTWALREYQLRGGDATVEAGSTRLQFRLTVLSGCLGQSTCLADGDDDGV